MSRGAEWARAYTRQAKADFEACNRLRESPNVPHCHRLQFLQMACEKLCKAHVCKTARDANLTEVLAALRKSHGYIAKPLPGILRKYLAERARGQRLHLMKHFSHLAREIELLSPAVDDAGRRPDNCEYPWEIGGGSICIPAEHQFTNLDLLTQPDGRTFLNYIRHAISESL